MSLQGQVERGLDFGKLYMMCAHLLMESSLQEALNLSKLRCYLRSVLSD